jgi:8-oxo-dGTP pyrophosphatase MutT (NUDIX family)
VGVTAPPSAPSFDDRLREWVGQACTRFPRIDRAAQQAPGPLKAAAVAVVLVQVDDPAAEAAGLASEKLTPAQHPVRAGEAAFLLTRRVPTLRAHSGQWALPGGRVDAGETAVDTALRELDEELGLTVPRVDVLGLLDDYPTRSGYLITPVVLWARDGAAVRPNPQEVQSVHRISLSQITRADAVDFIDIPESPRKVVRVGIGERRIHAPTAAVLYQFRELLAGRVTRVDELEQPRFAWK